MKRSVRAIFNPQNPGMTWTTIKMSVAMFKIPMAKK
jgi:hypothetical protein